MVLQWLIRSVISFMSSAWSSSYEILNLVFFGCAWYKYCCQRDTCPLDMGYNNFQGYGLFWIAK